MSKKQGLYLGKAGHLMVMSEFLLLGWNVAIPEVDIGDDVYVVEDGKGSLRQIQVKTRNGRAHKSGSGFSGSFTIKADQLLAPATELYFAFIVRFNDTWIGPLIISRPDLLGEFKALQLIPQSGRSLNITITSTNGLMKFRGRDWKGRLRDFTMFPPITH